MENVFLLKFDKQKDASAVIRRGPWAFNGRVIVMPQIKQGDRPSTLIFDHVDFWVHHLNAPFEWVTKKTTKIIASQVEKVIAV